MGWIGSRSIDGGLDLVPTPMVPGRLWLCGKRVVGPDPAAALERAGGASIIVCFNEPHELEREYPSYVAWLKHHTAGSARWFPVPDLHAPDPIDAEPIVRELCDLLTAGEGLILHCAGGIGRAPTIAICVLIRLGMNADDAVDLVARCRPTAGPEAGPQWDLVRQFAG